jgi:hypothetical protein
MGCSAGLISIDLAKDLLNTKGRVCEGDFKLYIPNFKLAFEHFCIHAGGRAVLDELQKNLRLSGWHMEPSRMTLHRFGNTLSSSLWYELAYTEAKGRVCEGNRVWQIAFGSGFKCNSAVWRALRPIPVGDFRGNPWVDSIDRYPVEVQPIFGQGGGWSHPRFLPPPPPFIFSFFFFLFFFCF